MGLFPIVGQPVTGSALSAKANVFGPAATVQFEVRSEAGNVLQAITLAKGGSPDVGADEFFGTFTPPPERFRIYAVGTDSAGRPFSRAFPLTFQAQSVKVEPESLPPALGAGSTSVARFKVTNLGPPGTFAFTAADATDFVSGVSPSSVSLGTMESTIVEVSLTVPAGTPENTLVELSLVARRIDDSSITNNAVVALVVGAAGPPPCTRTLSGDQVGPLAAGAGEHLCLENGSFVGPVTASSGGTLTLTSAQVTRGVRTTGARFVKICGSSIAGGLSISGSTGPVTVGDPAAACTGNRISSPGVTVSGNTGGVMLGGNTVATKIECSANDPAPVNGGQTNSVFSIDTRTGQCAAL